MNWGRTGWGQEEGVGTNPVGIAICTQGPPGQKINRTASVGVAGTENDEYGMSSLEQADDHLDIGNGAHDLQPSFPI
jgi:hypothetical protein